MKLSNIAQKIGMIPNLTQMLVLFSITVPLLVFVTLLPAFLELKKPRDKGPRMIMETAPESIVFSIYSFPIEDIEREQKFDVSLIHTIAMVLESLPNLDV
ncbi:MAG: hypothetical protein N3E52_00855 [Candidatus Bathyarchaeota archaeon]|nr:hypothetical protein [Candidatus Bathyarchaeota archaeon]